jgi:hypothetical protein
MNNASTSDIRLASNGSCCASCSSYKECKSCSPFPFSHFKSGSYVSAWVSASASGSQAKRYDSNGRNDDGSNEIIPSARNSTDSTAEYTEDFQYSVKRQQSFVGGGRG